MAKSVNTLEGLLNAAKNQSAKPSKRQGKSRFVQTNTNFCGLQNARGDYWAIGTLWEHAVNLVCAGISSYDRVVGAV